MGEGSIAPALSLEDSAVFGESGADDFKTGCFRIQVALEDRAGARPADGGYGRNGVGKSSVYRALRLLADVAQGRVVQSLALDGGLQSTFWAGPEKFSRKMIVGEEPVHRRAEGGTAGLKLGFSSQGYSYAIELGPKSAPSVDPSVFALDPQIKLESLWTGEVLGRANLLAERRGLGVRLRGDDGAWRQMSTNLASFDGMMTHSADTREAHVLLIVRETLRAWRFYDFFRTDRKSPARRPQWGFTRRRWPTTAPISRRRSRPFRRLAQATNSMRRSTTPFPGRASRST